MSIPVRHNLSRPLATALLSIVTGMVAAACTVPNSEFAVSIDQGNAPLEVIFSTDSASDTATFNWDFGDGSGGEGRSVQHVYESAGEFIARLTVSEGGRTSSSERRVKVEPGSAGWVVVTADESHVRAGESIRMSAVAYDTLGNPVEDATILWEANAEAGTVTQDGVFTAAAVSGVIDEAVTASFERLDAKGTGSISLRIDPGPIARIELDPPQLDLIVGQRLSLSATVLDEIGAPIEDVNVTFSAVRPGDSATVGGELIVGSQASGGLAELVRATATRGSESLTQAFFGTVKPSVLDEIIVTPSVVELGVNERVSLAATGQDRFGNPVPLDDVQFSLADEHVGAIGLDGTFTAADRATNLRDSQIVVKGWSNGVWRKAEVPLKVVPGPASSIEILPPDDSVPMGAGSPMVAIVRDQYGNEIPEVDVEWSAAAGGNLTADGVFVAGFEAGDFSDAIVATVRAGAVGNPAQVRATTSVTVRPRSSDMIAIDIRANSDSDIALIDLRTSTIRVLADELPGGGTANESGAAWYPDGSRLVFSSDATGIPQVYDLDLDSGDIRQLTEDPNGALMPVVSPDGTRLAWVSAQNGRLWRIYAASIPSPASGEEWQQIRMEDAVQVSQNDDIQSLLPFWSPDGSLIAYTASRTVYDNDVRVVRSDGTGEMSVISDSGFASLGWSLDGSTVRATVTDGDFTGLLVDIEVDSGHTIQSVPVPMRAFSATWAPDGSEVAIVDRFTGDLWITDTDGTGVRIVLSGSASPTRTAWRPVPIDGPLDVAQP